MAQWSEVDGGRAFLRSLPVLTGAAPESDADAPEPVALFAIWLQHAVNAGVPEPHAMTISTVDPQGMPRARVLILKAVDNAGWHFAVNAVSQKGHDLEANPVAALTFYWPSLVRQVRVTGPVVRDGTAYSAADFLARPLGSRAMALTRRQSQPLTDLLELETEFHKAQSQLERDPGLVPDEWVSYAVRPVEVEFWQGAADRRHVRLAYRRIDDEWEISRLWP